LHVLCLCLRLSAWLSSRYEHSNTTPCALHKQTLLSANSAYGHLARRHFLICKDHMTPKTFNALPGAKQARHGSNAVLSCCLLA